MRYFIELSYNGNNYHGWQRQPNAITIQEVLEQALTTLLKKPIEIVGAGRTDTGVHAQQMFTHFNFEEPFDEAHLKHRLNVFLPKDIAINSIFKVNESAHARFDAVNRTYLYRIATIKNVFNINTAYLMTLPLAIHKMNDASKLLLQYRNFKSFSKTNTDVKTYFCKIENAYWSNYQDELHFNITANRFLRNMVRAIVGTMIEIGLGKISVTNLNNIIASENRNNAGFSAPAHGLYLTSIKYPKNIIYNVS